MLNMGCIAHIIIAYYSLRYKCSLNVHDHGLCLNAIQRLVLVQSLQQAKQDYADWSRQTILPAAIWCSNVSEH